MNIDHLKTLWQRLWRSTVFFAGCGISIRIGANLILIPLVTRYLSPGEQALWWVFVALGNFANLADFGLGQSITRVYSYFWAGADNIASEGLPEKIDQKEPNLPRIRALYLTVRHTYALLSLGAMLILGIIGTFLLLKPISMLPQTSHAWWLWGIYLTIIGGNFWAGHWHLANQGMNRVREMHAAYVWCSLSYLACASVLLLAHFGLVAMICATLVRTIVLGLFARRTFHNAVPILSNNSDKPDFSLLSKLWPNAWKFGVLSVGGYLIGNGSVIISSHFLGETITASVGLTNQIGNFVVGIAAIWLGVKWPEITILRAQGKLQQMSVLFARRLTFVMVSYLVLATIVIFFGPPLLEWKRSLTQLLPTSYLILYFSYLGVQTFYVQFGMLAFTENVVPFFKISLFTGAGLVLLSLILTPRLGLWGLLLAPLIAEWVCSGWFTIRRGFQGQSLTLSQFWHAATLRGL